MPKLSVALISDPVGKTPADIPYSFVFDEAYQLAQKGIHVNVIRSKIEVASFSYGLHFYGLEKKIDVNAMIFLLKNLCSYPPISIVRLPSRIYWENLYSLNVCNIIKKNKIDLIHAHFAYPEGLVGLLAKRETKKPLIITVHGYDVLVEPSIGYGVRLDRRIDAIIRRVLNAADVIIAASDSAFQECQKIVSTPNKVQLIPNGVDIKRFRPNLSYTNLKKSLGITSQTVVFTLRSHAPKYGIEYLIRAASIVMKQTKNVVFIIGGDGPLRLYHEQLASKLCDRKKLIFTGKIPQSDVPFYYAMSDIVVVPSLQEAFGLAVTEAMACGKPVIGTNVGGIPDQIVDGYNGFLVSPKDSSMLAEKILYLLGNPEIARLMGIYGREIVEKKFNLERRADSILALYNEAMTVEC